MSAEETDQLTESADLLPEVQPVPLVGDGLQHLLQGAVQLAVLLLRWPDSLTQTGEGRHLRAGIMTVRANSYRRRHRFTVANTRLEAKPQTNPVRGGAVDPVCSWYRFALSRHPEEGAGKSGCCGRLRSFCCADQLETPLTLPVTTRGF